MFHVALHCSDPNSDILVAPDIGMIKYISFTAADVVVSVQVLACYFVVLFLESGSLCVGASSLD